MNKQKKLWSRRQFLTAAAAGAAGVAIIPHLSGCKSKPADDTIRLGFIGLGQQAMFLLKGFMQVPGVKAIAGCDVYGIKRKRFEKRVNDFHAIAGTTAEVQTFEKYQDLLGMKEIDAVVIAIPDHAHAMIAIAALKAGKDVYLEKPMTFTIKEGQELKKVVRETGRVFGLGSQQRSSKEFQHAVKLVQDGALGNISLVNAYVGAPPTPYNLPEEPVPADLNWDLWLGPLPETIYYNNQLNPPISLDPEQNEQFWGGWRWYKEMGGGFTTDWGAHMFDIAQWALGMDDSGPVKFIPPVNPAAKRGMKMIYASGIEMMHEDFGRDNTVRFIGSEGTLDVSREFLDSKPAKIATTEISSSDERLYFSENHYQDWKDAIKKRSKPVAHAEVGHRSASVCNLANISYYLHRTLDWDPENEQFIGDKEANKLRTRKYRKPYSL